MPFIESSLSLDPAPVDRRRSGYTSRSADNRVVAPDLDSWLEHPQVRIRHRRVTAVAPEVLWAAARCVNLRDARRLGRLIRWRIPGLAADLRFDEMFRSPPFNLLHEDETSMVSGLVGRIWTLRRDYPRLRDPDEFREWSARGTVRVLFANWVEPEPEEGAALVSETRVSAVDRWGRLGLGAVRPLIARSHGLIATDGIDAAVRAARDQSASADSPSARRRRSSGATR
jgi:hypothetical protein